MDPDEESVEGDLVLPGVRYPDTSYVRGYTTYHILNNGKLGDILSNILGPSGKSTTIADLILSFLRPAHLLPMVSTLIVCQPLSLPDLNLSSLPLYEQHLVETIRPICADLDANRVSSFWLLLTIQLDSEWAVNNCTEVDMLCERVFDLLATFTPIAGNIRPREQLRLDPRYLGEAVILVARYRHNHF